MVNYHKNGIKPETRNMNKLKSLFVFLIIVTLKLNLVACYYNCKQASNTQKSRLTQYIPNLVNSTKNSEYSNNFPCLYTGTIENIYYILSLSNSHDDINNKNLVIWMNGGPGFSMMFSFFYEHGPLELISSEEITLRNHNWSSLSNILYIDFPFGTGFSNINKNINLKDFDSSELKELFTKENLSKQFNSFLKSFIIEFAESLKIIDIKSITLSGEGAAGLIIPFLTKQYNNLVKSDEKAKSNILINNILLSSPILDIKKQLKNKKTLVKGMGLLSETNEAIFDSIIHECEFKGVENSYSLNCSQADEFLTSLLGNSCLFDVRNSELSFKDKERNLEDYLNKEEVLVSFNIINNKNEVNRLKNNKNINSEENNELKVFKLHNPVVKLAFDSQYNSSIDDLVYLIKEDSVYLTFFSGQFGVVSTANTIEDIIHESLLEPINNNITKLKKVRKDNKDREQSSVVEFNFERLLWKVRDLNKEKITIGYISQTYGLTNIVIRNAGHFSAINKLAETMIILKAAIREIKYTCPITNYNNDMSNKENENDNPEIEINSKSIADNILISNKLTNNTQLALLSEECYLNKYKCLVLNNCNNNGNCNDGVCSCDKGYVGADCNHKFETLDSENNIELEPRQIKVFDFSNHYYNSNKTILLEIISNKEHSISISLLKKSKGNELTDNNTYSSSYSLFSTNVEFFVDSENAKEHYLVIKNNDYVSEVNCQILLRTTSKLFLL